MSEAQINFLKLQYRMGKLKEEQLDQLIQRGEITPIDKEHIMSRQRMPDMEELESLHNCNIIDVSDIVGYDTIFILDNTWDTIMETDSDHLLESLNEFR